MSVASRFLVDIPAIDIELRDNIAQHMAFAHEAVNEASQRHDVKYLTPCSKECIHHEAYSLRFQAFSF